MAESASDSDWNYDDVDWDPELKKIFYDDSWVTKETKFDDAKDWEAQKAIDAMGYSSYPDGLLELFRGEWEPPEDGPQQEKEKSAISDILEGISHQRKSTLTQKEMLRFLKLEKPFKRTQSIEELKKSQYNEYMDYKALQTRVLQEQEEYQKYLYEVATKYISEYNFVDPEAVKWVKRRMNAAVKNIKGHKRYYVHMKDFGINVFPFKNDPLPTPVQNLTKTLGSQKRLTTVKLTTSIPSQINQNPTKKKSKVEDYFWKKCPVSEDGNALRLAIAWKADIVISHGTLQTLADNHPPFQNEWEVPIVVKACEQMEYSMKRKIAFVDKLLPPKRIAPREKNWLYFKEVFKYLSDVPDVWGRIPTLNAKSNKTTSQDSQVDDVIMQVDGASDDKFSSDTVLTSGAVRKMREVDDVIMQVDGASDNKRKNKARQPQKMGKKSSSDNASTSGATSKTQGFMSLSKIWMKETDHGKSLGSEKNPQSLLLKKSSTEGFQPFIGRKSISSLLPSPKGETSSNVSKDDSGKGKEISKGKAPIKKFDLGFSVLPDSALSSSQDETETSDEKALTIVEEEIKSEPIDETSFPFTPRRSTRKKSGGQKNQSASESPGDAPKSAISLFAKARSKARDRKTMTSTPNAHTKTKKNAILIESDTSSDDEVLSRVKKRVQNKTLRKTSETDNKQKIETPTKKKQTEKKSTGDSPEGGKTKPQTDDSQEISKVRPVTPLDDLLGQIVDKQKIETATKEKQVEKKSTGDSPEVGKAKPHANIPQEISKVKPVMPLNDLLGQIMGKQATSVKTREDVSSVWGAEARRMGESDSDSHCSTTDLCLQELPLNKNVTYTLWKFGKNRVLIRYTLHGSLPTPSMSKLEKELRDPGGLRPSGVSLRTKLEYQSNAVFEHMTMSEMCRDWVTMLFKRPSKIVRLRIDPHKREVMDVEWTMTLNHLQDRAAKIGYSSAVTSKLLTNLFGLIGGLDTGYYICCHRENENKVIMRQGVDDIEKKVVYDLHKEYSCPGREVYYNSSPPWVPGDPHKPRNFHTLNDRIPMTFDPKEEQDGEKQSKQSTRNRSNKKKKKK